MAGFLLLKKQSHPNSLDCVVPNQIVSIIPAGRATFPIIRMIGDSTLHHERGHVHSPIGIIGKNEYRFRGTVTINGTTSSLDIDGVQPIGAVAFDDNIGLLLQDPFFPRRFRFLMRPASASEFRNAETHEVIEKLCGLKLDSEYSSFCYRIWLLNEAANSPDPNALQRCFQGLAEIDPRFAYDPTWKSKRDTGFVDLLTRRIMGSQRASFVGILGTLLMSARKEDNCQDVMFLALTILDLNEQQGRDVVCEFVESMGGWQAAITSFPCFSDSSILTDIECRKPKVKPEK